MAVASVVHDPNDDGRSAHVLHPCRHGIEIAGVYADEVDGISTMVGFYEWPDWLPR